MLLGFLLVVLILVCVALGGVILLQRSEGGALGMGGGPSGFMTARGAGDLLTRTTWILAGVFFLLCLSLTLLSGHLKSGGSVVDRLKVDALNPDALAPKTPPAPAPLPTGAPALPGAAAPAPALEAPRPQVNVAPAARSVSAATPMPRPVRRAVPPTTTDTGATSPVSKVLGLPGLDQTAPSAQPTLPSRPAPTSAVPVSPAGAAPASGANSQ